MVSVQANSVFGVMLVGLLFTMTACARHNQIQTQRYQAAQVEPSSTTKGMTSTQELVPVNTSPAPEPKELAPTTEPPASTVRPPNDGDDPRAVIDWLLDRSQRGR